MRRENRLFRLSLLNAGLALVLLAPSFPSFGQTSDKELETALAEIALLKQAIAEHDRRIADLEKALRTLQARSDQSSPSSLTTQAQGRQSAVGQPSSDPWKAPSTWERVKDGMSQAQVIAILGQPTSVENTHLRTLFYRGEVPGSGFVSGNVKLVEDRVYLVNKPVF